jgi:hypothetical protein
MTIELTTADSATLSGIRTALDVDQSTDFIVLDEDFLIEDASELTTTPLSIALPSFTWSQVEGMYYISLNDIDGGDITGIDARFRVIAQSIGEPPTLYGNHYKVAYNYDMENHVVCTSPEPVSNRSTVLTPLAFDEIIGIPVNFNYRRPTQGNATASLQLCLDAPDLATGITLHAGSWLSRKTIKSF